ncbi:MAG: hypothetical protein H6739_26575 [Alphaproteobacteria bacterium]|nr:hypothetical protein [Alphaproteobacteria bacterium]
MFEELQGEVERDATTGPARVLRCARCDTALADAADVVPASRRAYMNPHGYVREIVVVSRARNLTGDGRRVAAFSWFPGHTWEIMCCAGCLGHVGWRFEGGSVFYGLLVEALA